MECLDESSVILQILGDSDNLAVYTRMYSNIESAEKRGQGRVVKSPSSLSAMAVSWVRRATF
jgi:hypothetical protein